MNCFFPNICYSFTGDCKTFIQMKADKHTSKYAAANVQAVQASQGSQLKT